jgi:hypothetical protein
LASTIEWLLAENVILKVELQKSKDILGARKTREGGKRLVLKGKILISTTEILKAIEEAEEATKNKKKTTGKPRGRPRKITVAPIVIVEEAEEDGELSDIDPNDPDR